ncbi:amidase, partial [Aspergillus karnatakaensis]|uniref:amidase n=1 Tax=Aspergillus karnatakaensis TaxID=1810916 RepID=UPI003CCDDC75
MPSLLAERIQLALNIRDGSLEKTALLNLSDKTLPQDATDFPRTSGLLSNLELELTENYDATALVNMLAEGKVTAVTLLTAFRKRATIAQQCTNCLTELIPQAIEDAKACDEYLARTGRPLGPLHGLPISVKEQINIAGRRTNAGFVALIDNISTEDAQIITSLKRLGAVIFARTNQPQSLMQLETNNNIYGETVNPRDRTLTAGGSSGGEGALMAMRGTPMGIGGDIGGSIRVPAALNGLYGFYPSVGRLSGVGAVIPNPGNDSIPGTLGPFTRSLRDIRLFCNAYALAQPWLADASLIPYPILSPRVTTATTAHGDPEPEPGSDARPLRIGLLSSDGVVPPSVSTQTLLSKIEARLKSHQATTKTPKIEIIPFNPNNHALAWQILSANYFEDSGAHIRALCESGAEPLLPLTSWILSESAANAVKTGDSIQERKCARDAFRNEYLRHWMEAGVDVVIAPVLPGGAW